MSSTEQPTTDADTHKGGHLLYPQPGDGKLIPLVVQSFQRPSLLPENVPWTRLGEPLSKAGTMEAIWYWVLSPILVKGSERVDYSLKPCFLLFLRLLAAGPLCALMIPNALASIVARIGNIKSKSPEQIDTQCQYPKLPTPLPHSSSSSSSSSSSLEAREALPLSSDPSSTNIQLGGQLASPRTDQTSVSNVSSPSSRFQSRGLSLGPRYLCFITDPETRQYSTMKVSDYNQQHGDQADTEFVFVSYTRLQFRVFTDAEINAWTKYGSEEIREANRTLAHRDRETLIQWGIDAALAAGKRAFWLDFECVRDSDGVAKANVSSKSEDVYRICDIVRAAHSMIIAIGPPADEKEANILNGDENVSSGTAEHANKWLRQWGSRLWTLPELLLCPNEYRIKLCVAGDVNEPKSLAKRNFAERAWDDAESVKELVNHYEGSAILPPTQLISIALECFARRKTDQFSQGDIAYAVMGLFPDSQRPVVNQNDSGFRAFARLALAVEGSSLLTRLLCLAPAQPGAQWSDARDYWGVKLKDFRPCCDAVDVAGSNAVEVQNIPAAPICWDKIQKATFQGRLPIFPEIIFVILLFFPLFTWYRIAHLLIFAYGGDPIQGYVSRFLFLVFMVQVIFTPLTLPALFLYEWKIRRTDLRSARLVGMEGVVDCATAERHIYGYHCGRLREISSTTTTSGSETAIYEPGAPRKFTFTLIDTCAQTLRVINCAAPPIAMMLCGEDAAGHRAILCSYNHETGVYHREETLLVEECVRQQMKSARSVNLSLEPFPLKLTKAPHDEDVINSSLDGQAPTKSREWKPELVFFIIQCIATPQYRIIQLSEVTHRNSFVLLFFGFVLAQPIAFFLLHKRLFSRAVAPMVYLQAAFQSLSIAKTMKYETIFIIVFQGIAIGLFLPYMVLHTISWHSIRETAFRLLFLTSSAMMYRDKARQHATGALYISIFALFSTSLLDLPEVKPWTNSFEGVSLTRRSARHKFSAEEREHAPRWARQDLPQSATIISLLFFIMATVSNSIISGALINTYHLFFYDPNVGLKSFYCLLTFFITILLWIYPHFIHTVTLGCSTISILGLYGCSMLGSNTFVWPAMASAQLLILPLSWIWIVHRTTSWKGFITYVTLSLAGWGGWRLANNLIGELGKQKVFIFAALQPCLFGCVWVLEVIRERRVAQAAQRRLVRSEYQDNVAEAGLEMNEKVVQSDASQGFEEMKAKKWPLICWFGLLLIERALSALNTSMH